MSRSNSGSTRWFTAFSALLYARFLPTAFVCTHIYLFRASLNRPRVAFDCDLLWLNGRAGWLSFSVGLAEWLPLSSCSF